MDPMVKLVHVEILVCKVSVVSLVLLDPRVSRERRAKKAAMVIVGRKVFSEHVVMLVPLEPVVHVVVESPVLKEFKDPRETKDPLVHVLAVLLVPWEAREKQELLVSLAPRVTQVHLDLRVFLDKLEHKV